MTFPPSPEQPQYSGQPPYPQQQYGQAPSGQGQYGQGQYGQGQYGQPPYGQPPYGQGQYGQPLPPRGAASPDDLSLPLYGATFGQAVSRFLKQYADFTGRASRSEYWWSALFTVLMTLIPTALVIVGVIVGAVSAASSQDSFGSDSGSGTGSAPGYEPSVVDFGPAGILISVGLVLLMLASLALIVPSLAISWRRLHDGNFPGPFYFLTLVPSVGSVILLVLLLLPSKAEGQRFDQPAHLPTLR